jgi:hypothetical protein
MMGLLDGWLLLVQSGQPNFVQSEEYGEVMLAWVTSKLGFSEVDVSFTWMGSE